MKKTLVLSVLVLSLNLGVASAADLTTSSTPAPDAAQELFTPKPTPAAACTVSCWTDPTITCTSQAGNCSTGGFWGVYWITCDGVRHMCPEF